MIEIFLKEKLEEKLMLPCVFEEINDVRFVLLDKTGSFKSDYIESVTFAIQSYAESMYEAAALNERVKEAVESLIECSVIVSVKLNSDYNFTDTQSKRYRYQAVYTIKYYKELI